MRRRAPHRFRSITGATLLLVVALVATEAAATDLPPHPYFSLDTGSVSFEGDTPSTIFSSPRTASMSRVALGLSAGADLDAVSPGTDTFDASDPCGFTGDPFSTNNYWWSVDAASVGAPSGGSVTSGSGLCETVGSPVRDQASSLDAAADTFGQVMGGPRGRVNIVWEDESEEGLRGLNLDELDALEEVSALTGTTTADQETFFSVDPSSAGSMAVSAADVLRVPAASSSWSVKYSAADLGLAAGDDIDAMCVDTAATPHNLLISLGRGSPSLSGGSYSAADVFKVAPGSDPFPGSGSQVPFLTAEFFSMLPTDNIDGLDCSQSIPPTHDEPPPPWWPVTAVSKCKPKKVTVDHGQIAKFEIVDLGGTAPLVSSSFIGGYPKKLGFKVGNKYAFATKKDPPGRIEHRILRFRANHALVGGLFAWPVASYIHKCELFVNHHKETGKQKKIPKTKVKVIFTPDGNGQGIIQPTSYSDVFTCSPGGPCEGDFPPYKTLSFMAVPSAGSELAGWSGCDSVTHPGGPLATNSMCVVNTDHDRDVGVTFQRIRRSLTVGVSGVGTVHVSPGGQPCASTCTYYFDDGAGVTLSWSTDFPWVFVGWFGACSGIGGCNLTMDGNKTVQAQFVDI